MDTELLETMLAWEAGDLSRTETAALFQTLIDCGLIWRLANFYGRTAMQLLESGHCIYHQPQSSKEK